jgi:hypothetical protein
MGAGAAESIDESNEIDPIAAWYAIRDRVQASASDLSDEERQALADEISDEIGRNITARLRPDSVP